MQPEPLMQDQASRLRQWVRQYAISEAASGCRGPGLVVVLGGHPGVGATSLAMNLAAALGTAGIRSVILDGDLGRADATRWSGIRSGETLADVVSTGRTLADVLQPGPAGFSIVPGIGQGQKLLADPRYISQRILDGLRSLTGWAEIVVADLGSQLSAWIRALWRGADCRLVVTSPEQNILMDTYAVLKLLSTQVGPSPVHVVVNRAADPTQAQEVYERLANTCLRFLALPVSQAGFIPVDGQLASTQTKQCPEPAWRFSGESAERIVRLAHLLAQMLGQRKASASNSSAPASGEIEAGAVPLPNKGPVRSEPIWEQTAAAPPQWHVKPGDWVGRVGFPVTVSPSLDEWMGENRKKV